MVGVPKTRIYKSRVNAVISVVKPMMGGFEYEA